MATGAGKKDAREAKERQRLYEARRQFHAGLAARRRRDNLIAGLAGGVLLLAIVGAQVAYFTVGPGVPQPVSTETPAPSDTPSGTVSPAPTETDGTETPAPTDTGAPSTPEPTETGGTPAPTPTDIVTPSPTP